MSWQSLGEYLSFGDTVPAEDLDEAQLLLSVLDAAQPNAELVEFKRERDWVRKGMFGRASMDSTETSRVDAFDLGDVCVSVDAKVYKTYDPRDPPRGTVSGQETCVRLVLAPGENPTFVHHTVRGVFLAVPHIGMVALRQIHTYDWTQTRLKSFEHRDLLARLRQFLP